MRRARIDVLSFKGCPNCEQALELVERVTSELGVVAQVRLIDVPEIRVKGRHVEPGADARHDYSLACRIYRTEHGVAAQPDERWLRLALQAGG